MNDVTTYSKYYNGVNEPPPFYNEHFDFEDKIFVAAHDYKFAYNFTENPKENAILHYYEYDTNQNKLQTNNLADRNLHNKFYAVTSPDFSADSSNCWSCFNESNILKSRICAYRWQTECDESTILNLIWTADRASYKWAFGNVERGSTVSVSSQSVKDIQTFENGIRVAIDMIQPDNICWNGKIFEFMAKYYDLHRIIKMQTRSELMTMYKRKTELEKNGKYMLISV